MHVPTRPPDSNTPMDDYRQSWRIWLLGLLIVASGTVLFVDLGRQIAGGSTFDWEVAIMLALPRRQFGWLNQLMLAVSEVGYVGAFLFWLGGAIWLRRRAQSADALALFTSGAGALILTVGLKLLYARPRPDVFPLTIADSFSFPSGHTLVSVGSYGMIAYLLWRCGRWGWSLVAALAIVLIGVTRVYLGVHYPSDIAAALAIGAAWITVVAGGHRAYRVAAARRRSRLQAIVPETEQKEKT